MADSNKDQWLKYKPKPGVLIPFEEKLKEFGALKGDPDIIKKAWEDIEQYANRFIWMCLTDI
jgi:hypothetical protein